VKEEALAHWGAVAPKTNKQSFNRFCEHEKSSQLQISWTCSEADFFIQLGGRQKTQESSDINNTSMNFMRMNHTLHIARETATLHSLTGDPKKNP